MCFPIYSQKSHSSLKRRVSEQATELNRLARMTSTEMSSASASEVTPDPGYFAVPHGRPRSKEQSPQMSPLLYKGKIDDTPVSLCRDFIEKVATNMSIITVGFSPWS